MKRRPLAVVILLACTVALAACNSENPRPSSSVSRDPSSVVFCVRQPGRPRRPKR